LPLLAEALLVATEFTDVDEVIAYPARSLLKRSIVVRYCNGPRFSPA